PVEVDEERLAMLATRLREVFKEEQMIEQLLHTIRKDSDEVVQKIQPYWWADRFGFNRQQAIELFLLANEIGLVNYGWSMMCPNCRVPKQQVSSLKQMKTAVHCDLCGVDYELDFDRYIEMTFAIHPSVRKVTND